MKFWNNVGHPSCKCQEHGRLQIITQVNAFFGVGTWSTHTEESVDG